jgi:short-subunit dehydrogenase
MSLPKPADDTFVLVTGAAAGIGLELARCLAARGHQLLLADRDGERLVAVAAQLGADARVCDLTVKRQRDALIAAVRRDERALVGLCNNAGIFSLGRFHELPYEREAEMVAINAVAVHHLTGALLALMVDRGEGAILNTASLAANQPLPGCATYAATKAFVHSFSEAIHTELAGTGVSCTSLQPGVTATNIAINAGLADDSEEMPRLLSASAADVARAGVEGMERGRRTVVPGVGNRALATPLGRFVPRTIGLPLTRLFASAAITLQPRVMGGSRAAEKAA